MGGTITPQSGSHRPANGLDSMTHGSISCVVFGRCVVTTTSTQDPPRRMKSDRQHEVPLSQPAVTLLKGLHRESEYLFPGMKAGKPLSNMAMLNLLKKPPSKGMGYGEYTVHGFRSTFRDWAGETIACPHDLAEMALAHTVKDKTEKTEAAYRRSSRLTKRRKMMSDWAKFCGQAPGEVTKLRAAS